MFLWQASRRYLARISFPTYERSELGDRQLNSDSGQQALPLFVGLTTLPSRIGLLRATLDSLKAQSRPPDRVLVCLPRWSRREQCAYERPCWLDAYAPMVQVVDCADDYGPGTKLLGCLDHLPASACLVLADDDMRYRPYFLESLYRAQLAEPTASFSFWTFPCGGFKVGQGADGFSFYTPNLSNIRPFAAKALQHPRLRVIDDLWISAYLQKSGISVKSLRHLITDGDTVYEVAHNVNQLRNLQGELDRERAMSEGALYLLESGMMGRSAQLRALTLKALRKTRNLMIKN